MCRPGLASSFPPVVCGAGDGPAPLLSRSGSLLASCCAWWAFEKALRNAARDDVKELRTTHEASRDAFASTALLLGSVGSLLTAAPEAHEIAAGASQNYEQPRLTARCYRPAVVVLYRLNS